MANKKLKNFEYASHTQAGKLNNAHTDEVAFFESPNGYVFLVCDGKGEGESGKSPAQIVVERIRYYLENELVENPSSAVYNALIYANGFIYEYARKNPTFGSAAVNCSLVLIRDSKVYYATVGQARIMFFNGRRVYVLSQETLADDAFSEVSGNALGQNQSIDPEVNTEPLVPVNDDVIVLCSDGFYENVSEKAVQKILDDPMPVQNKVIRLVDMAVTAGTDDSISMQLLSFYNLDHAERAFSPAAGVTKKPSRQNPADKEETDTASGLQSYFDFIQEKMQVPAVQILMGLVGVLLLGYMFYDMFIREPRPARQVRTIAPQEEVIATEEDTRETTPLAVAAATVSIPADRAYNVQSGDTWGRIYTRFGICSWFIRNHPSNAGKFDADENPVAGTRLVIPVVYSSKRDLNPDFYQEFSIEKTGSRCENANTDFLEKFKRENLQ